MRILAIDYGRRHTGLALSDSRERVASSLTTLHVRPKQLVGRIANICAEYGVEKLVIGYPLGLNRKPTQMSKEIDEFIVSLEKLNLPIIKWNETATSQLADQKISYGDNHSEAARMILKEFIDHQKQKYNETQNAKSST